MTPLDFLIATFGISIISFVLGWLARDARDTAIRDELRELKRKHANLRKAFVEYDNEKETEFENNPDQKT